MQIKPSVNDIITTGFQTASHSALGNLRQPMAAVVGGPGTPRMCACYPRLQPELFKHVSV